MLQARDETQGMSPTQDLLVWLWQRQEWRCPESPLLLSTPLQLPLEPELFCLFAVPVALQQRAPLPLLMLTVKPP